MAPATTLGGGWATVGLSSLPNGTPPGEEWVVDLTVLQHGRHSARGGRAEGADTGRDGVGEDLRGEGDRAGGRLPSTRGVPVRRSLDLCGGRRLLAGPRAGQRADRRRRRFGRGGGNGVGCALRLRRRRDAGRRAWNRAWRRSSSRHSSPPRCGVAAGRARRRDEGRPRRGARGRRCCVRGGRPRRGHRGRRRRSAGQRRAGRSRTPAARSSRAWVAAAATRSPLPDRAARWGRT